MTLDVAFLKTSSFEYTGESGVPHTYYYLHVLLDGTEYSRLSLDPSAFSDFSDLSVGDFVTVEFVLSDKGKLKVTGLRLK